MRVKDLCLCKLCEPVCFKGLSTHDVLHGVPSDEALDMSYLSEDAVVAYNLFCPKLVVIREQEQYSKLC